MWTELGVIQRLKITQAYNMTLFYLQRIPVLGKKISNRFYNAQKFKMAITILGNIAFFIKQMVTKVLYAGFLNLISIFLLSAGPIDAPMNVIYLTILPFYSLISGSFVGVSAIEPNDNFAILCIKHLKMTPKSYYLAETLFSYLVFGVTYFIVFGSVFHLIGESVVSALFFTTLLLGLRLLIQLFYIFIYRPESRSPQKLFYIFLAGAIIIGNTVPFLYLFGLIQGPLYILYSGWAFLIGLVLIGIAVSTLNKIDKIHIIAKTALSSEKIQESLSKVEGATVAEVKLKDDDLSDDSIQTITTEATGIEYINIIFIQRLGHLLNKRIRTSFVVLSIIILILIGIIAGGQLFDVAEITQSQVENLFSGHWHILIIYASSFAYLGDHFTKFCFYHMDRMMMKNNYYREPKYLLEAIWIRFKISLRYNAPIFLLMTLGTVLIYFISGGRSIPIVLLDILSTFVMLLFFTMHYLFLYYLIQPYTENMNNKSPAYRIAMFVTYYAPFLLFQSADSISQQTVLIIYGAVVIYLVVGMFAVIKLAPERFKLR